MAELGQTPVVEGVAEADGIAVKVLTAEYCPFCENETFNMPENRVSLCTHCGAELFPCTMCEQEGGCQWSQEDYGCQRFVHTPAWVEKQKSEDQ